MASTIYDIHIATLQVIDHQFVRLHNALRAGDGDDDITQEQITQLQDELIRLSKSFGDAEIKCITRG